MAIPLTLPNNTDTLKGERYGPKVHTINNANPDQGVSVMEGHGKYPVIFKPLQNVQTGHLIYEVTSFIDFTPYLDYFQQFEGYLEAFKTSIQAFKDDPVMQEFRYQAVCATSDKRGEACKHYPACYVQPLLYKVAYNQARVQAFKQQHECCMSRHMQACLVLKQFEYIRNVAEYVNENYQRVKSKFLRAIDYVVDTNIDSASLPLPPLGKNGVARITP